MASFIKAISSVFLTRSQHDARNRDRQQQYSNCSCSSSQPITTTLPSQPITTTLLTQCQFVPLPPHPSCSQLTPVVCSPGEFDLSARSSGVVSPASPPDTSRSARVARPRLLLTNHNSELPLPPEQKLASPALLSPEDQSPFSYLLTPDDQSSRSERGFSSGRDRSRTSTSWATSSVDRVRDTSSNLTSSAALSISPASPSQASLQQLHVRSSATRAPSRDQIAGGHLRVPHSPSSRSLEHLQILAQPAVHSSSSSQNSPPTVSVERTCTNQPPQQQPLSPPQAQQKPNRTKKPNVLKLILRSNNNKFGDRATRASAHESPLNSPLSSDGSASAYVSTQIQPRKSFVFTPLGSTAGTPPYEHPESVSSHVRLYKPFAAATSGVGFARRLEIRRPSVPVGCLTSVSPLITSSQGGIAPSASRKRLLSGGALSARRLSGANARRGSLLQQQQQQTALGLRYQLALASSRSRSSALGHAAPSSGNLEPNTPTSRCSSFLALSHRSSMTHGSQLDLCMYS